MPLKNTIAFERRIDLASLFCMIGRHGPAVVMAVLGMVCVVAGFIIYRTVRERWRRSATESDDRDSHAGHRGAALGLWEEEEPSAEGVRTSTGSTDTSEGGSSDDQEEDTCLSHKVRHRRAAAKTQPYKDTSVAETSFVWDLNSHKPMGKFTEEAYQSLESDFTYKTQDVTEEVCTKEPEVNKAVHCEEEEKVFDTGECEDVSEEECRRVEKTVQFTFNNPMSFSQPPNLTIQENENNTSEAKRQEPNLEKLGDISVSASHFENEANETDQCQTAEETVPSDRCDPNIVAHSSDEQPTDHKPFNLLQEVSNDNGTINTVNIGTLNIADTIDLPLNCQQQSEPPRLDEEINQNGVCPEKLLHQETEQQNAETSVELKIPAPADPSNLFFEQFEPKDNSMSSLSLESGISSMTVSPDVEVLSEEISAIAQDQTEKMVDQEYNEISGKAFAVSCPSENILIVQNTELELDKAEPETVDQQKGVEKMVVEPSIKQDAFIQCEDTALPNQAADQGKTVSCTGEHILGVQNAEIDLKVGSETICHQTVDEKMDIESSTTLLQCEGTTLTNQTADPGENILIIQNAELELNKAEAEAVDQCDETAQPNQAADQATLLSSLKDNTEEELSDFTHNIPQDEVNSSVAEVGQSSYVASSCEDFLLLRVPPSEPTDVIKWGETSSADISIILDTAKVSEEQQTEHKEDMKTPHLDDEIVCPIPLLCHTTEPEIDASGQKDTIYNASEQLVTEVHIPEDIKTEEDQQTTVKAEIQEQNQSLQHLDEADVLQFKDSHDNLVSESLEEDTKKLEVTEEKQGGTEESIVQEEILILTPCPESAIQAKTVDNTVLPDTTSNETCLDTNIDISNKTEAGDLNVSQLITTETSEGSDLEVSSRPIVFDSPGTFPDLAVSTVQTQAQNSASTCPDLVKVENEKENLSGIKTEAVEIEMEPKEREHDLDTNNTEVGNQNGCQTFEGSSVQVPTQIEIASSSQTVKALDSSCTQDMVVTEGIDSQISAEMDTDTSLDPRNLENEVIEENSSSRSKSEIVHIKDSQVSTLNEHETVPKEYETPFDCNNGIPTKTEAGNQNGCQNIIDDTFEVSAVVSSQSQSESSCQTNDSGASSDVIASTENTYLFLERKFEYQHVKIEVSDHAKMSNMDLERSSSTAPVDLSNPSLEQSELKDIVISSSNLENEISSIAVSPDVEVVSEEINTFVVGHVKPKCEVVSHDSAEFRSEDEYSLCAHDVVVTNEEETVTIITGPTESSPVELSPQEDISNESLVTNEDSFGSEIEVSYQKAMEEFMTQVADKMNRGSEVKKQINVDKKEQVCAVNQGETEKMKVEFEKTEISIMEATMDHNEWITDGNYQVLPWMNAPLFVKNNSKEPEIPQIVENKPEETTENAKKVLAVQPMPQNVNVTFRVHYLTLSPTQTVAVTGDQQELGSWKNVIPLQKVKDGYWSSVVSLPAESHVEWKFVVLDKGEVCRWEECGNRLLYTGYGDDLLVHKWWGFL